MRRICVVFATLAVACGAIAPDPPYPRYDAGTRDAALDVAKLVDAPIYTIVPASADAGAP